MAKVASRRAPKQPVSMIASAGSAVFGKDSAGWKGSSEVDSWQNEAWAYFNQVGELRYICSWLQNALSRCTLVASDINPATGQPTGETDDELVAQTIADIAGGPAGQSQLLGRLATFLTVPGEGYIAIIVRDGREEWHVLSKDEVVRKAGVADVEVTLDDGTKYVLSDETDTLARVYRPHPRQAQYADSPIRASLPTLREMVRLSQWVEATAKSRLAGNGIFVVPNEMSLPKTGAPHGEREADPDAPGLPPVQPDEFDDPIMYDRSAGPSEVMQALIDAGSTAIQSPDTAAALLPLVMQGPGEWLDKMQHITFSTQFTEVVIQLREAATRRLALTVDVPAEILLGTGDMNHWCVDDETEALTLDGWKRQHDIGVSDVVLTLNHETGLSEWKPVLDVYRADVVDEPVRYMETQRHNSLTTLAHRWPVLRDRWEGGEQVQRREWTTSGELDRTHAIITGAPHGDMPETAKHSDALVELVAWYWTEGNLGVGDLATIAQSHTVNAPRVDRIRAALSALFGPGSDTLRGSVGPAWRENVQGNVGSFGGPVTVFYLNKTATAVLTEHAEGRDKLVRAEFVRALTRAQLELFIDVSCQGDGWHYRQGKLDVWQKNPAALDAFELALILSGRAVSRHPSGDGEVVTALQNTRQRPGKSRSGHREQVIEMYTGTVWCPTTENSSWFARRDGQVFYTGNSAWQVEESAIKLHVEPLLTLICDAITEFILRPLLEMKGHPDPQSVMVWYSTKGLTMRPNRSEDSKAAYDRRIIDAETYRKELGYDETNAIQRPASEDEKFALALQLMEKDARYAKVVGDLAGIELPEVTSSSWQGGASSFPADEKSSSPIPDTKESSEDATEPAAVRMALYASVLRRVEIAGKRLRTRENLSSLSGVAAEDTHLHLPTVSLERAMKLVSLERSYDEMMCGNAGVSDVDLFSSTSRRLAAELVASRRSVRKLDLGVVPPGLLGEPKLKRVQ